MEGLEVSVDDEIAAVRVTAPHVVILGAGASRAAFPCGDRNGLAVPVLRDVAEALGLVDLFPADLKEVAVTDFEAAYSRLFDRRDSIVGTVDQQVREYFGRLQLPETATLYDVLLLCLRGKDAVCTFNWDPFIVDARVRLTDLGVSDRVLPRIQFLHGNVRISYCVYDGTIGVRGRLCGTCRRPFRPSPLLFPVEKKNYQDGGFLTQQWSDTRALVKKCFMLTVFGYSAPRTDIEAVALLQDAWGTQDQRALEQTELINRPGADEDELRDTWDPFIHTHHYEVHDSFYNSWLANHPRRSGEAFENQYLEARFISDHPVPRDGCSLEELVGWFGPLLTVESS